jgi:hypothetical protein
MRCGGRHGGGWLRDSAQAREGQQLCRYGSNNIDIEDAREIVGRGHPPRAAGARPRGHGRGTRPVHLGSAPHCGRVTPRPASAPGRCQSARHRRCCDRGGKRAGRHHRPTVAREARDAVDARGLNGFGRGHGGQDGGESPRQHRVARPGGAEQEEIVPPAAISEHIFGQCLAFDCRRNETEDEDEAAEGVDP